MWLVVVTARGRAMVCVCMCACMLLESQQDNWVSLSAAEHAKYIHLHLYPYIGHMAQTKRETLSSYNCCQP